MAASARPTWRSSTSGCPTATGSSCCATCASADPLVSRIDPNLPVLVLSGRGSELDRVRGFECGCRRLPAQSRSAIPELRGRIGALLRRARRGPARGRLRVGPLELDPLGREVRLDGEPIQLSKKEYALLRALAEEPTRVFTREELLRGVWGYRSLGATRTLDSHASRLRQKLSAGGRVRGQRLGRRLPADRRTAGDDR